VRADLVYDVPSFVLSRRRSLALGMLSVEPAGAASDPPPIPEAPLPAVGLPDDKLPADGFPMVKLPAAGGTGGILPAVGLPDIVLPATGFSASWALRAPGVIKPAVTNKAKHFVTGPMIISLCNLLFLFYRPRDLRGRACLRFSISRRFSSASFVSAFKIR